MINLNKSTIFKTELGEKLYEKAYDFVNAIAMNVAIEKGVLVGFSGGADSVLLLLYSVFSQLSPR